MEREGSFQDAHSGVEGPVAGSLGGSILTFHTGCPGTPGPGSAFWCQPELGSLTKEYNSESNHDLQIKSFSA